MYKYTSVAIVAKRYRLANSIISGYLKEDSENKLFLSLKLRMLAAQKKYDEYLALLKGIDGLSDPQYAFQYANVLVAIDKQAEAKSVYRHYLSAKPGNYTAMYRLIKLGVSGEEGKALLARPMTRGLG